MSFSNKPKANYKNFLKLNSVLLICILFLGCGPDKKNLKHNMNNDLAEEDLKGQVESITFYFVKEKFGEFVKTDSRSEIYFNGNGDIIKSESYNDSGNFTGWREYEYEFDSQNRLEKKTEIVYDENDNLEKKYISIYERDNDKNRNEVWINKKKYNSSGNLTNTSKKLHVYDGNGRLIKEQLSAGLFYRFKYDNDGMLIEKTTYFIEGYQIVLSEKVTYNYNEKGDLIKRNYFKIEGNREIKTSDIFGRNPVYKYEYDEYDNWLKRTVVNKDNDEIIDIDEREITYEWEWF